MDALIGVLLALAVTLTGIPAPEYKPEVLRASGAVLELIGCKTPCPGISALSTGRKIFIRDDLDLTDIYGKAILLHELVHFLQYARAGQASDCVEQLDREIVAYQLQNAFLWRAGARLVHMPRIRCEERGIRK